MSTTIEWYRPRMLAARRLAVLPADKEFGGATVLELSASLRRWRDSTTVIGGRRTVATSREGPATKVEEGIHEI
jgi:hypothetical protein